ncbi:hypothetical protein MGN70_011895 [Eutypa lata]|nr:hypothetical protein MGN70_011895 [Eutypa lata]
MTRAALPRLGRLANQRLKPTTSVLVHPSTSSLRILRPQISHKPATTSLSFSTSARLTRPLAPDVLSRVKPSDLTDAQYHELSDEYLDNLLNKFEAAQDERDDIDVEYSAGVMNINITGIGTYVINKQPPNKQIWLSSPISGPKRFDYVIVSDGQHQKEGTATGGWVYLRDGATLNEILNEETGIDPEGPPLDSVDI